LQIRPCFYSSNGELAVQLNAEPGLFRVGDRPFEGMLYNGAYIPPLLRVRPGDALVVRLNNRLTEMTNLHFHGLNVSPRANSDNVFVHVHPGMSFTYRVEIPTTHHPGLFWYHSHAHGRVSPQIIGGLSGGLIIEGSDRFYPFLKEHKERVLLIKHIPHPEANWQEVVTVNGMLEPTIPIQPGEVQHWRIGNIGADLFLKLKLESMPLYVLATDGHYLRQPTPVAEVMLGPGQRIDAVVIGGPPGRYQFKSVSFPLESGEPPLPERLLGVVESQGPPADIIAAEARVKSQTIDMQRLIDALKSSPIAHRRTMTFSRTADKTQFFINGKVFDEKRTDVVARLGDTEEWTIRNEDDQLHNFHIHQTDFLVTEINGVTQPMDSLRDTFTLPAATNGKPSEVKVIIPFTDPNIVGRFVFHCHVVKHEDKGMMQTIEVVRR
jgi:suppressor of ftsI